VGVEIVHAAEHQSTFFQFMLDGSFSVSWAEVLLDPNFPARNPVIASVIATHGEVDVVVTDSLSIDEVHMDALSNAEVHQNARRM
jgi:hypothetical protein